MSSSNEASCLSISRYLAVGKLTAAIVGNHEGDPTPPWLWMWTRVTNCGIKPTGRLEHQRYSVRSPLNFMRTFSRHARSKVAGLRGIRYHVASNGHAGLMQMLLAL
jgi:hypothetical protein